MTTRAHHHDHHGGGAGHHDESRLADMLDLDAEVFGSYLDEVTDWVQRHAPEAPRTVIDVGAGTGTGTLALMRRFTTAQVVAIDRSALMLERLRAAARARGLEARLGVVQADLDAAWPPIGAVDVAWAASSLHHVADPDRLLRDIHAALNPGGLLTIVEMDALPRFLPDDIGLGRPGLEARCHDAAAQAGWNAHPDWRPHLERAGFERVEERSFAVAVHPAPPSARRYARAVLSGFRSSLAGRLAAEDLDALGRLLADDGPGALLNHRDLSVRASRTGWAARRTHSPAGPTR